MRKKILMTIIPAALASMALAAPAMASDIGSQVPPNLVFSNSDYNGHAANGRGCHENNLGSVDYYDPTSPHNITQTQSEDGDSRYVVHLDLVRDGAGSGGNGCTRQGVVTATGHYDGSVQQPGCANPNRNPCDGTSAFYVAVHAGGTGFPAPANDGTVDFGQQGTNLP